jgi:hypothetical protein
MPPIGAVHGQDVPRSRRNLADPAGGHNVAVRLHLCIHTIDFQIGEPYSLPVACAAQGDERLNGPHGPLGEVSAMTTFDNRKDAAEKKFAHDAELQFKATARRNKLLGLWVAEKLGKTGEAAEAYAKDVVKADFEEAGDEDVFRKVHADLTAASAGISDHVIRRTMEELMAKAIAEIQAGA